MRFAQDTYALRVVCLAGLLHACATPYQAAGFNGGYRDVAMVDGRFVVSFEGNAYTSAARVHHYLLRRCAEVANAHGYAFFTLAREVTQDRTVWPSNEPERAEAEQQVADGYTMDKSYGAMGPNLQAIPQKLDKHRFSGLMQGFVAGEAPDHAWRVDTVLAMPEAP